MRLSSTSNAIRSILALAFDFLVAANFSLNFAQFGTPFLDIGKFIAGAEGYPFQYRILTAPIFGLLLEAFKKFDPAAVLSHFPSYLSSPEQLAYFTVNGLSFFIALVLFRKVSAIIFAANGAFFSYLVFIALSYLWFILNPGLSFLLPYDLPALAFCQALLLCVLRGRWILLCAIFAIATLNRETTYLIVLIVLIRWWLGLERRPALAVAAILTAIWVATKIVLVLWLSGMSGAVVIAGLRIGYNLAILAKPWQWPILWPLLLPVGLCVLGLRGDPHARQWSVAGIVGFLSLFSVANIIELRAYGDLIGFLSISTVIGYGGWERVSRGAKASTSA